MRPHEVCIQPHGPVTPPHSHCSFHLYQRICTAIFMQSISQNSRSSIHAKFNLYHDAISFAQRICASAFTMPLFGLIYAANLKRMQREAHIHCRNHTAAIKPQHLSCLHATTFVLPVSGCHICATALISFTPLNLTLPQSHWLIFSPLSRSSVGALSRSHSAAFMAPHSRCHIHSLALCSSIHAAALKLHPRVWAHPPLSIMQPHSRSRT